MSRHIIIANGDAPTPETVQRWLRPHDVLIGADGGCRIALQLNLRLDYAIGDFDSLSEADLQQLHAMHVQLRRYPPQKDETDLELALQLAISLNATEIVVLGALGGRLDHEMANLMLLAMAGLDKIPVIIADATLEISAINAQQVPTTLAVKGNIGDTLSLIPFGGDASGIVTQGLQYPLRRETLRVGPARGVSNVMTQTQAQIEVAEGLLLCIHHLLPV